MLPPRPLIASLLALFAAPAARAQHATVSIPGTELRSLHSTITGRDYDLYIYPPPTVTPGKKYPILYLLDAQWDFKLLTSIQGGLLYDKYVPDVIIAGITYSGAKANYDSLRAVDYTPVAGPANPGSGQGPKFLDALEKEIIPFVERNYPADPTHRALGGSSLGGLFTLYTLFTQPSLFQGYLASSPAVTYANSNAFAIQSAFARSKRELPVKLYVSVGGAEPLHGPVTAMVDSIKAHHYAGLTLESRVIDEERHSGNKPEAFNRGMRFLFRVP